MQVFMYLWALFERASQKSVLLTDRLTVLIVPFSTLVLWLAGAEMTDTLQETLLLGVAMTVLAVISLRLVAASYLLWREDQDEKKRLQRLLDGPFQREKEASAEYVSRLRCELSDNLASIVANVELLMHKGHELPVVRTELAQTYFASLRRTRELINALSYDVPTRIAAYHLSSLATKIGQRAVDGEDIGDLYDRLQELKKLAFRLIHKRDDGPLGEFVTMLEVQNICEGDEHGRDGETTNDLPPPDDPDLKVEWLREKIKDPELRIALRERVSRLASGDGI